MKPGAWVFSLLFVLLLSGCESQKDETVTNEAASPPETVQADPQENAVESTPEARGAELAGMFTYMADAAVFEDCRSNKVFPVSMEGAYIELERAYLNSGIDSGQPLLVQVEGRFLERPAMEGNRNEVKLIVDSFTAILPEQSCVPPVDEPIQNTYWKLDEVGGQKVSTPEGQREAHMVLTLQESKVRGNAGCNNFFGTYTLDGDSLGFGQMGSTMMACLDGMETEAAFLAALESTDRYTISGLILQLYKGETLLAKFEAVHLP
jgi:heat shock protein HslJ